MLNRIKLPMAISHDVQVDRLQDFTPKKKKSWMFESGMLLAGVQTGCFHSERSVGCFDSTSRSRVRSRRQPSVRQFIVHSHSRWDPSHRDMQADAV